jgi:hypothetical protein
MTIATTTYSPAAATKLALVMRCRKFAVAGITHGNDFALAGRYMR